MRLAAAITLAILLGGCNRQEHAQNRIDTGGGDAKRGQALMTQYGCNACHSIPGVNGPRGMVGPPLDGIGARQYIAGKFPNTPQTMMQWLQNPQAMDPNNAMPNLGVTPDDARDMTAYLITLRSLP